MRTVPWDSVGCELCKQPQPNPTYELVHTQTAAVSELRAAQLWWGSQALLQRTSSALAACLH